MTDRLVTVDGVELCLETFGDPANPAVLLISGAAASMDWWDGEFCERLAEHGRHVIRYDHRDTGRSVACPAGKPAYSSNDLSADALRVLDALGVARAHLVGHSMGGGIAQVLAASRPGRSLTLTLISTSPAGARLGTETLPPMEPRVAASFADPAPEPAWNDRAAVVNYLVETERGFAGSRGFDEDRARRRANTVVDRTRDIATTVTNHWVVIGSEGASPEFRMADIALPTLVLHGTADPLLAFGHGEALAAEIPGATLVPLDGMGHETLPPELWCIVVPAIAHHTSVDPNRPPDAG